MLENIPEAIRPFLNAILIGFGGFLLAFVLSKLVERALARPMGQGWSRFVGNLVAFGIGIWTIKLILDSTGAAGLVVVLVTAITGAFAIGSERFAGDLVSGISLLMTRTYAVGDHVQLAGYEGRVSNISLMITTLENVDGDLVYIRNAEATGGTIVNFSPQPGHLIVVKVPLPVSQDLNVAVSAIEKAIQDFSPELKDSDYQPAVLVESSSFGYLTLEVHAYVTERLDYSPEQTRLFLLAVNAIKQAGLTMVLKTN